MIAVSRVVVLGNGLFGWNLSRAGQAAGRSVVVLARAQVDFARPVAPQVAGVFQSGDVIVNAAGATNVDACEDDPAATQRVNAEAAGELAAAATAAGARFVHVSSDAVLDATNAYARSKVAAEAAVMTAVPDALLVRVSTTFGPHPTKGDFVQWVLRAAASGEPFTVLDDMVSSPTYAPDAARAVLALTDAQVTGVRHCANHAGLSRYDFADLVLKTWGVTGAMQRGRLATFKGFRALRPRDTSMPVDVAPHHDPMPLEACLAAYRDDATQRARRAGSA